MPTHLYAEVNQGARSLFEAVAPHARRFHVPPTIYNELYNPKAVRQAQEIDLRPPFDVFEITVDEHTDYPGGWYTPNWVKVLAGRDFAVRNCRMIFFQGSVMWSPEGHFTILPGISDFGDVSYRPNIKELSGWETTSDESFIFVECFEMRCSENEEEFPQRMIYQAGKFNVRLRRIGFMKSLSFDEAYLVAQRSGSTTESVQDTMEEIIAKAGVRAAAFNLLLNSRHVSLQSELDTRTRQVRRAETREYIERFGKEPPTHHRIIIPPEKSVAKLIKAVAARLPQKPKGEHEVRGHKREMKSGRVTWVHPHHRGHGPLQSKGERDAWKLGGLLDEKS